MSPRAHATRPAPPNRPAPPSRPERRHRPRGIALLMSLAVVMLLTFFMSEYFFATGLELRGMSTFKDAQQAQVLSRSVLKATEVALQQDEVTFFEGYRQLQLLLLGSAVPWDDGLLLRLEVIPQDHLFNLNQNHNQQPGQPQDRARGLVFIQLMERLQVPSPSVPDTEEPLAPDIIAGLYASLTDWIDDDSQIYVEFSGISGAEDSAYFSNDVPYVIKNGMLDRLQELRIVRGVRESNIPWPMWEQTVTALPRNTSQPFYFTERVNVNTASRDEIETFLAARLVDPNEVGANQEIHEGINEYAERAEELATYFVPEEAPRKAYDSKALQAALKSLGFTNNYGVNYLFSAVNEYYLVRIVTEVGNARSRVEVMLHIPRDASTRFAKGHPKRLWVSFG